MIIVVVVDHCVVMCVCGLIESGLRERVRRHRILAAASSTAATSLVVHDYGRVDELLVVEMMIVAERDRLHAVLMQKRWRRS